MNRDQIIRAIEQHVTTEWTYKDDVYLDGVEDAADAILALDGWQAIGRTPHKVMTREEYDAMTIRGAHVVDHSAEPGATHLWHLPQPPGDAG